MSTRQPYAYVADNPLNGTDASGLCGIQLQVLIPVLCVLEHVSQSGALQGAAKTPAGHLAQQVLGAEGAAAGAIGEHAVVGGSVCFVGCIGLSFQGGQLSLLLGPLGVMTKGRILVGPPSQSANAAIGQRAAQLRAAGGFREASDAARLGLALSTLGTSKAISCRPRPAATQLVLNTARLWETSPGWVTDRRLTECARRCCRAHWESLVGLP
jgi:hypothetical protein